MKMKFSVVSRNMKTGYERETIYPTYLEGKHNFNVAVNTTDKNTIVWFIDIENETLLLKSRGKV